VFYCNTRQRGARPDGPFTIIVQHFDGRALKPHEQNPVAFNAHRRFFLAQDGDVAVEREWANYTLAPTREAALLSREIRVRLHNDTGDRRPRVVHREYRNSDGKLHRSDGPAWFCYMDEQLLDTIPTAYVEEYWHDGQPRAGSDGWRLQYDDRGVLRGKYCYSLDRKHCTKTHYDTNENATLCCEWANALDIHRVRNETY
jgi:hypothetical protein